jgi:integrase
VTIHALRHTHASQLIDADVDIVTISKRLGHAKPDITLRVYAQLSRRDDSKAAAAINAALGNLSGNLVASKWPEIRYLFFWLKH